MKLGKLGKILGLGLGVLGFSFLVSAQILYQTFSESVAGFRITVPNQHWKMLPRTVTPGSLRATLRFETPVDRFVPNLTVQVFNLEDSAPSLAVWVDEEVKKFPEEVHFQDHKHLDCHGHPVMQIEFVDSKSELKFVQWILFAKGKRYILTASTRASNYARFAQDFQKIFESFELN